MAAKAAPKKNLSALKRVRQSEKKNMKNRMVRSSIRTAMKSLESAIKENNKENVETGLRTAIKTISGAQSKGVIHKNNASRKISKLMKKVNALSKSAEA